MRQEKNLVIFRGGYFPEIACIIGVDVIREFRDETVEEMSIDFLYLVDLVAVNFTQVPLSSARYSPRIWVPVHGV